MSAKGKTVETECGEHQSLPLEYVPLLSLSLLALLQ